MFIQCSFLKCFDSIVLVTEGHRACRFSFGDPSYNLVKQSSSLMFDVIVMEIFPQGPHCSLHVCICLSHSGLQLKNRKPEKSHKKFRFDEVLCTGCNS